MAGQKVLGEVAHTTHVAADPHELDLHLAAERGQAGVFAVAIDERCAQFLLEALNGAGQARLRNPAKPGGRGEIERFGEIEEVSDLVQFHGGTISARRDCWSGSNLKSLPGRTALKGNGHRWLRRGQKCAIQIHLG